MLLEILSKLLAGKEANKQELTKLAVPEAGCHGKHQLWAAAEQAEQAESSLEVRAVGSANASIPDAHPDFSLCCIK